jgi:hypothetical protein
MVRSNEALSSARGNVLEINQDMGEEFIACRRHEDSAPFEPKESARLMKHTHHTNCVRVTR